MSALIEAARPFLKELAVLVAAELRNQPAVTMADDPLMGCREAGAMLGISTTKARDLIRNGHVKQAPGFTDAMARRSEWQKFGKGGQK